MKKFFLASAIAALPFSAQAADLSGEYSFIDETVLPPAPSVIGHLELAAGWTHIEFDDPDVFDEAWFLNGWGRVNIPLAGNWNLEFETGGELWYPQGSDSYWIFGTYGHLWMEGAGFRAGVVGGVGDVDNDATIYSAGIEGEVDAGNATLGAQAMYNYVEYEPSAPIDDSNSIGLRGWVDYYTTPNTRLHGEIAYWWYDFPSAAGDAPDWSLTGAATLEHRFAGTPVSAFGTFEFTTSEFSSGLDMNRLELVGGIRLFFDPPAMTLQEHDRQLPFTIGLPKFI